MARTKSSAGEERRNVFSRVSSEIRIFSIRDVLDSSQIVAAISDEKIVKKRKKKREREKERAHFSQKIRCEHKRIARAAIIIEPRFRANKSL